MKMMALMKKDGQWFVLGMEKFLYEIKDVRLKEYLGIFAKVYES